MVAAKGLASLSKMPPAAVAALVIGVLLLVLVVVLLLWKGLGRLFGGLSDTLGAAGDVGSDVGAAASGLTSGLATAGEQTGNAFGNFFKVATAPLSNEVVQPTLNLFGGVKLSNPKRIDGAPDLVLHLLEHKNSGGSGFLNRKENSGKFKVTANGQPVANAKVEGILTHPQMNWTTKRGPFHTNAQGIAEWSWWVRDIPGTAKEDDIEWQAVKDGFNPSNRITTK